MTAPTVPTAPLPSLLPCPFCGEVPAPECIGTIDDQTGGKWGAVHCCGAGPEVRTEYEPISVWRDKAIAAWNKRSDAALLTMRRERDQWKSRANIAAGIIETATDQLAASERTCAELRASIDRTVTGMNELSVQSVQLVDENAKLRARAEAAERTVEGLRGKP